MADLFETFIQKLKQQLTDIIQFIEIIEKSEKCDSETQDLLSSLDDIHNIVIASFGKTDSERLKATSEKIDNLRSYLKKTHNQTLASFAACKKIRLNLTGLSELIRNMEKEHFGSNKIILAQEEERKRISREIHDGPAQTLASLIMNIDYCMEMPSSSDELKKELSDLKKSVLRSLNDIRRFIFDLRPMALDDLGLVSTLEQFISGFRKRTGVPVYINVSGNRKPLEPDVELSVFRVIQEASNNAARHAQPSAINIFLRFDEVKSRLQVAVKDNGNGFDVEETRRNYASLKKLGLISMQERVRLNLGEFEIVSDISSGTVVSFWIPI